MTDRIPITTSIPKAYEIQLELSKEVARPGRAAVVWLITVINSFNRLAVPARPALPNGPA